MNILRAFVLVLGGMAAIASSPSEGTQAACCDCLGNTSEDGSAADASDNCLPDDLDDGISCSDQVSIDITAGGCAVRCFAECKGAIADGVELKFEGTNAIQTKGGSTYTMRSDVRDWQSADDACSDEQAHLLVVNDTEESDFINANATLGWIGLSDLATEGTFVWVDGSSLTFEVWNDGEPNEANDGEDCVTGFGGWNDDACSNTYNYTCESD